MNQIPVKATHQQTKIYNSQLVLKTLFDYTPISRVDVARLTHLTHVKVVVIQEAPTLLLTRKSGLNQTCYPTCVTAGDLA